MNYIYMVRYKTIYPAGFTEPTLQIASSAFYSRSNANLHALKLVTSIFKEGGRLTADDPRVALIENFKVQLYQNNDDFCSFSIACNWSDSGDQLKDDTIEIEKLLVNP